MTKNIDRPTFRGMVTDQPCDGSVQMRIEESNVVIMLTRFNPQPVEYMSWKRFTAELGGQEVVGTYTPLTGEISIDMPKGQAIRLGLLTPEVA